MLVGLMGIKKCGKSAAAEYLVEKHEFEEISFSSPLKKALKELFLFEDHQVYGTQEQKETSDSRWFNCSPRKIMQFVGTDLLRDQLEKIMPGIKHDVFVKRFALWYLEERKINPNKNYVISDVRFHNEMDYIQQLGGIVIRINRPGIESNDFHSSEQELLKITSYNHRIENDGTLEEYFVKLMTYIDARLNETTQNIHTVPQLVKDDHVD